MMLVINFLLDHCSNMTGSDCKCDSCGFDNHSGYLIISLYIPSTVVQIGGKSQPWFDTSCKLAASSKRETYQIWAKALVTKDPEVKTSKIK